MGRPQSHRERPGPIFVGEAINVQDREQVYVPDDVLDIRVLVEAVNKEVNDIMKEMMHRTASACTTQCVKYISTVRQQLECHLEQKQAENFKKVCNVVPMPGWCCAAPGMPVHLGSTPRDEAPTRFPASQISPSSYSQRSHASSSHRSHEQSASKVKTPRSHTPTGNDPIHRLPRQMRPSGSGAPIVEEAKYVSSRNLAGSLFSGASDMRMDRFNMGASKKMARALSARTTAECSKDGLEWITKEGHVLSSPQKAVVPFGRSASLDGGFQTPDGSAGSTGGSAGADAMARGDPTRESCVAVLSQSSESHSQPKTQASGGAADTGSLSSPESVYLAVKEAVTPPEEPADQDTGADSQVATFELHTNRSSSSSSHDMNEADMAEHMQPGKEDPGTLSSSIAPTDLYASRPSSTASFHARMKATGSPGCKAETLQSVGSCLVGRDGSFTARLKNDEDNEAPDSSHSYWTGWAHI